MTITNLLTVLRIIFALIQMQKDSSVIYRVDVSGFSKNTCIKVSISVKLWQEDLDMYHWQDLKLLLTADKIMKTFQLDPFATSLP